MVVKWLFYLASENSYLDGDGMAQGTETKAAEASFVSHTTKASEECKALTPRWLLGTGNQSSVPKESRT